MSEHAPPSGTLTFLLIKLNNFEAATDAFDETLYRLVEEQAGYVFSTFAAISSENHLLPDNCWGAVFQEASEALAVMLQATPLLPSLQTIQVLHTGPAQFIHGGYLGSAVSRVTRLLEAAQPGQLLVSQTTHALLQEILPARYMLYDLGERVLRGMVRPEQIYELREISPIQPAEIVSEAGLPSFLESYFYNLVQPLAPLVGQTDCLTSLLSQLDDPTRRLVVLRGAAGAGKTRLALEAGRRLQSQFEGGVFCISLALLSETHLIAEAIAQVFELQKGSSLDLVTRLGERLTQGRCLVILDNFEPTSESAGLIDDLLLAVSNLTILVTSRLSLAHWAAQELFVPPLTLPDPAELSPQELAQNAAVQLFAARAAFTWPDFELNTDNAEAIAGLCHLLEGRPFALELVAARVRTLKPTTILNILQGRFAQARTTALDNELAPPDPLELVVEWNYDGLTTLEKRMFERAAVFRNGATLAMLAAVYNPGSDSLNLNKVLDSLQDKKFLYLVSPTHSADLEPGPRYAIFETLRSFALERLRQSGEYDLIQQRYARYYLQLVEQAEPALMASGSQQAEWLARLETEHINLRMCLNELLDETRHTRAISWEYTDQALQLCSSLWRFWMMHSYLGEGRQWLEWVLHKVIASPANLQARAKALLGLGTLCWLQSDYEVAGKPLEQSLTLFEQLNDQKLKSYALNNLGLVLRDQYNYARAQICFEQSLALRRHLGERRGEAFALGNLGLVMLYQGAHAEAQAYNEQSLAIFRELDDHWGIAVALNDLAEVLMTAGRNEAARLALEEALEYNREVNDQNVQCDILQRLGRLKVLQESYAQAEVLLRQSLVVGHEIGYKAGIAVSLKSLALVALKRGEPKLAVRLSAASATLRHALNSPLNQAEQADFSQTLTLAQSQLAESEFRQAWAQGAEESVEELLAELLEPVSVGGL